MSGIVKGLKPTTHKAQRAMIIQLNGYDYRLSTATMMEAVGEYKSL